MFDFKKFLNYILYILTIISLIFTCLILSRIYFHSNRCEPPRMSQKPFEMNKSPENMLNLIVLKLKDALNLTDAQIQKLDTIKNELTANLNLKPPKFEDFKIKLGLELKKDNIDTNAILVEFKKIEELKKNDFEFLLNKFTKFHQTLTSKQKEKLVELINKMPFPFLAPNANEPPMQRRPQAHNQQPMQPDEPPVFLKQEMQK